MTKLSILALAASALLWTACKPVAVTLKAPDAAETQVSYYPGESSLYDVLIMGETLVYGKLDVPFEGSDMPTELQVIYHLKAGGKVVLDCVGTDKFDADGEEMEACVTFAVSASDLTQVPVGSTITLPRSFYEVVED